ncbi:MAG: murein biosynthesis integral membrane protein MurJ [Myxococcota bacterium]
MSASNSARKVGIAAAIWSAAILASRIIGLIREAVLGRTLGGGQSADVYFSAFILPDYLNYLLAGGALSLVFIPIFSKYLGEDNEAEGWVAFSHIANSLLLLLCIVTPILWWQAPLLATLVAPGFDSAATSELVYLTRVILPAQIFHILGGLLSATLQAKDKHTIPALAPLLYTASIIIGGLWTGTAAGFAWGALVGSLLGPFGLPLMGTLRIHFGWSLRLNFRHPDLKSYFIRSLPIMLGFSIIVLDDWFLRREGSHLAEGSVATLSYAKSLMKVPMGVFGLAIGAGVYPTLSRQLQTGDLKGGFTLLSGAVRRVIVLALIAQAALSAVGADIATVIYGTRLLPNQAQDIGLVLAIMCLGLWAWASNTVVARGYYALGNTWMPTLIGTVVTALAFPLYGWLGSRYGIIGLASTSTMAISVYTFCLMLGLKWKYSNGISNILSFWIRITVAVWVATGIGFAVRAMLPVGPPAVMGALAGGLAAVLVIGLGMAFKIPEISEVTGKVSAKVLNKFSR